MALRKLALQRLIRAAMGEIKADLIITGGKLVNVYSGEILDGMEIAVLDGRICYVGSSAKHTLGETTEVFDARGLFVSPGFIDGHTHIGHYCRPFEHLQSYLPRGTTSVVAACDELASVLGYRGLELFLDEVEAHPLRVYTLVSMAAPQDPLLCNTASFSNQEIAQALADPRVLGMGEIVSWLRLLQGDEEILERIEIAHANRRIIHGHTAGAKDRKLCAVAAAGISSCHEPVRIEDALERLRLGYWTMLREGSLRQDLESTLKPLLARGLSLERLILVTDSMSPDDVEERGHMDHVVRRAVSLGLSPIQAIQAVTLHPATYSGLEQEIGGIAPGRFADIVVFESLEDIKIRTTMISGKVVAEEGQSLVSNMAIAWPTDLICSLRLPRKISADQFQIPCASASARIRVMELVNQTITAEKIIRMPAIDGFIRGDPSEDLLKVSIFDRHRGSEKIALGFLKGFGAKIGAVGLTTNLDENTLMVVGNNDHDLALCANLLIESGGGMAVVNQAVTLEKLEFPCAGVFSLEPYSLVGKALRRIQTRLKENGSPFDKPIFALTFLTFVTLPSLRITSRGLVNAKERKIVSLFAE